MRRSSGTVRAVLLVCAAVGAMAVGSRAEEADHLGYYILEDEVLFVFDASSYEFVSRSDTGAWVDMTSVMPSEGSVVAVAGDFNGWSTVEWEMERQDPGVYELRRPMSDFEGRGAWPFKFVIDDIYWVEPPPTAVNVVPTGLGNKGYNLLLVLDESAMPQGAGEPGAPETTGPAGVPPEMPAPPEPIDSELLGSLVPPAEFLGAACVLKPIDKAIGAPIPVSSNPMITADLRVVGFVSMFVMPPTPEEEATWEAETLDEGGSGFMERMEAVMRERTANVRAALVAVFESPHGAETGVLALEFIEPLTEDRQAELAIDGPGGSVVVSESVAAAVWSDDREPACYDAVLAYVKGALSE